MRDLALNCIVGLGTSFVRRIILSSQSCESIMRHGCFSTRRIQYLLFSFTVGANASFSPVKLKGRSEQRRGRIISNDWWRSELTGGIRLPLATYVADGDAISQEHLEYAQHALDEYIKFGGAQHLKRSN